jgi:hypothetical protein
MEWREIFHRPFRTNFIGGDHPGTLCRANFRLSLRDEASRRKPMVKKPERFVKFRPRTPLREIIRLMAK